MKKGLLILSLVTCFSLLSVNNTSKGTNGVNKTLNAAQAELDSLPEELTKAAELVELNIDTSKIVSDIRLPHTGLYSTSITWESSDTSVINIEVSKTDLGKVGDIIGRVTQDKLLDKQVKLTATITYSVNEEEYFTKKEFDVTVLKQGEIVEEELPLAFNEDFSSYKTGIDLGNYFKWNCSGSLGNANIKEEVVNNVNLPVNTKMLEIESKKLSSSYTYTTKLNASSNNVTEKDSTNVAKVAFEFYSMFEGDTNGIEISLNNDSTKVFAISLSSSQNSFLYNKSTDQVFDASPKEGVWNKYRAEVSLSGYVKLYQYDFSKGSYVELTSGLANYNEKVGVISGGNKTPAAINSLKIKVNNGTKQGYTYLSDIKFDNIVNLPKQDTITNPNRDLGIGLVKDYPEEIYYTKGDDTTFNQTPTFTIENRFDSTKTLVKDSDYTVSEPENEVTQVGEYKLTTKTYTITLIKYKEIKKVKQYFYESEVEAAPSVVNFKSSYIKQDPTDTTKGRITITGNVYQYDIKASYMILEKGSSTPSLENIKANSDVSGKVDGKSNISISSSSISITSQLLDYSKEYDVYFVVSNTKDSSIYAAKEISTVVNISSVEDLYDMTINDSTKSSTFRLITDLDCSSYDWKFSESTAISFSGTFDGQGHTISNLTMVSTDAKTALFKELKGTVKNVTFKDCFTSGSGDSCILAGQVAGGNIENVNVYDSKVITNPEAEGSEGYYAILVGRFRGDGTVSNVKNVNIINCEIECNKYVGLLTGGVGGSSQDVTVNIENIYVQGKVNTEGAAVGLIGRNRAKTNITNAVIFLDVTFAKKEVGAIAGHNKEGGKIVANNILSDLKVESMTQPTYFNNFIGSHDANTSSYSGSNVNYVEEDYSQLGDSITPTKTAIGFGNAISTSDFSNQTWWEKNTFLRDLDVNLDWSFDSSLSRPIVSSKTESSISFTSTDYKKYIDMLGEDVSSYRYPLHKAGNVYKYLSEEEKGKVSDLKTKYDQAKLKYEEYIKQIEDINKNTSSIVEINL